MNNNGSGAFRKPESYSISTDLDSNRQTDNPNPEQPVKSLLSIHTAEPDVSLETSSDQQNVATAHPVGDIVVAPADADGLPTAPRRRLRRPHIHKPHIPRMGAKRLHPRVPAIRSLRPSRPLRVHTFDSFTHRNYRFLWASTLFFSGAFWLQQVIIGWLTYELTQSALLTSLAMGLDALPILIAGPLGGLLVDRWDKRKLLAGVFLYQAMLSLGFGAVVISGALETWHVFAFIFLMGVAWVIADPARMALIPSIVPRHSLVNAFALNSLAFSITRLIIPAIGGALLAFAGAGVSLLLEGALVACAGALAFGLTPPASSAIQSKLNPKVALSEILEGARYIRERSLVMGLLLLGFLPAVLVSPFLHGLIPVYAAEVYEVGPATLGLLMSSVGAGFLAGTLIIASMGDMQRKGLMIIACIAIICVSMLALALNPTITLAYPLVALGSMGTMGFFSITSATMQSILPDGIRGRVSGIYIMTFGAMPAGNLAAGIISENISAPAATMSACAVVIIAAALLMLKFPAIRKL